MQAKLPEGCVIGKKGFKNCLGIWESKGLNENTQFDYLVVTDSAGKTYRFGVQHQDMERVLTFLIEAAPQIKFVR
jgi:hypothetical protein